MANNPYVNKVEFGGRTLMDLTRDTVTPGAMLSGVTAHGADGGAITGSIARKAAQTYTPGTASQTVPAGVYLAGAQTIAGDANLVAANIRENTTLFGVTGTLAPGTATYYTGASDPSADLGSDGDIYLKTGT